MTGHIYKTILLLSMLAVCGSCTEDRKAKELLQRADGIMEDAPDSANNILDNNKTLFLNAGKAVRMEYSMLKTEAEDKLFITHESDSVMRNVADYYTENGTPGQQTKAFYLLGRVYRDMEKYNSAIKVFKRAMDVEERKGDKKTFRYKARAASWYAEILERRKNYAKALEYNKLSLEYAKLSDAPATEVYALRDIGRDFSYLKNNKKAIPYYIQAVDVAESLKSDKLYDMVMEELASIYIEEGMTGKAKSIINREHDLSSEEAISHYFFLKGDFYERVGQYDSAIKYNKKGIEYASPDIRNDVLLDIERIYTKQENYAKAQEVSKLHQRYTDSLYNKYKYSGNADNEDSVYSNDESTDNSASQKPHIVFAVFAVIIFIAAFLIIKNVRERKSINDNYKEEAIKNREQLISKFKHSDVYRRYHNTAYTPGSDDFNNLTDALNEAYDRFTYRLQELYPQISNDELWVCCMLKTGLSSKRICSISAYRPNTLSMARMRLYRKIFHKDGSSKDLDEFIRNF